MDIDFSPSALRVVMELAPADVDVLKLELRTLAAPLDAGQVRTAVFEAGAHLVSCTFERTPRQVVCRELRRLPPRRPTPT